MDDEKKQVPESKLPYARPEIVESGHFEDLLLTCGHFPPDTSCQLAMQTMNS
jgi:hypothetical protein